MGRDSKYIWDETLNLFSNFKEDMYQPHRSIPTVPDEFRKLNGNAYIPKVFSIGPRHWGRIELQPAEVTKLRYINCFFNRLTGDKSKQFISWCKEAVMELDGYVREIYTNDMNLDKYELATVMLYDGCFLLELLLSSSDSNDTHSTLKGSEYLLRDLLLLENQIPFVILEKLYNISKSLPSETGRLEDTRKTSIQLRNHALSFFGIISQAITSSTNLYTTYHLLDIVYLHVKTQWPEEEDGEERQHVIDTTEHHGGGGGGLNAQHLNRCATRLEAVGITIKRLNNNENSTAASSSSSSSSSKKCTAFKSSIFEFFKHNVKFNKSNRNLEIPQLVITPTTELLPIWKNFIAWENHNNNSKRSSDHFIGQRSPERFHISKTGRDNVFTSSALLFNDLICCPSDVQLLKKRGVIVDHSGKSNRELMDLFQSNICGVDRDGIIDPLYATMFHQLNTYSSPINYATKHITLLPHYFSRISEWIYNVLNFFSRGYNFVAAMATILTVVQTWYAILAYHHPKS